MKRRYLKVTSRLCVVSLCDNPVCCVEKHRSSISPPAGMQCLRMLHAHGLSPEAWCEEMVSKNRYGCRPRSALVSAPMKDDTRNAGPNTDHRSMLFRGRCTAANTLSRTYLIEGGCEPAHIHIHIRPSSTAGRITWHDGQ